MYNKSPRLMPRAGWAFLCRFVLISADYWGLQNFRYIFCI